MKVVHVVRQFSPSVGGLEDFVKQLCLQQRLMCGITPCVVTLDRLFGDRGKKLSSFETIEGVEVYRVPFLGSRRYPFAPTVFSAIKDADVVHVHAIDFFFDFLALTRWLHRKPLVASTHGGFFHTTFASRLKLIFFQTVTRCSCLAYAFLCASSDQDARIFSRIAKSKIVTIENGVDICKWADAGSQTPQRTLIFIGRWSSNKRVPLLFDLLERLQKRHPAWKLLIAGVPEDETTDSLLARAKNKGVEASLSLYEKPSIESVKSLLDQASYIVSASAYEGFGLAAIEGLSAGLIPVLTPLPPFQKILDGLGLGIVLDPENLDCTAEKLEGLHQTLSLSYASHRASCRSFAERYSWTNVAQRFQSVYNNLI